MTPEQIKLFLPDEPDGFHYTIEQVSPLIKRVWLNHHHVYDYNLGKPVRTVWGYIKRDRIHTPKDSKTPNVKSCCDLVDAWRLPGYTSIVPKVTDLTHLL